MKPSTSLSLSTGISVLLVGEPKSGKTSLTLAFPDPAVIDWDLNLASGMRRAPGKTFDLVQPSIKDDGSFRPLTDQWMYAVKETYEIIKSPKYKTIIIDGLGNMCNALCAHITNEAQKAGASKVKTIALDGTTIPQMEIQHYGDLARLLRAYIMLLRASGKYVLVTSHQTGDKDEVTKAIRYVLAIPGQSKDTLGGCFTDVWATSATPRGPGQVKYEIMTKPTGFHVALGASSNIDAAVDVTNQSPSTIWTTLQSKLSPVPIKT
jgi:hypothetical protein